MGRFGPKTCETTDPHNSAIYACRNTSSVVQQQQISTTARKKSDLPGYTVTLSWLLHLSVQSDKKDEMKSPSQHISIHPKVYSSKPAWNRWGQMVKLQASVIYTFIRKTQLSQLVLQQIPKWYLFCCWMWLCFIWKYQPRWASSEIPEWNNSRMKGRKIFKVTRRKTAIFQSAHEPEFTDTLTTRASISLQTLFNLICWWDQAKPSYSFCSLV